MNKIIFLLALSFALHQGRSQGVGIGTTTPNPKAALEIKSNNKGVLFPSLTTAQRDLITNPPDGLHIFNKEEKCLNYYDSINGIWNCYCTSCEAVIIDIESDDIELDFYNDYAKYINAKKYLIRVAEGVTLKGNSNAALSFSGFPLPVSIKIVNRGSIIGGAGNGGVGSTHYADITCYTQFGYNFGPPDAGDGTNGRTAISAYQNNVTLTIDNYGVIGGGGGGGGGGGSLNNGGGGGGGGQGGYFFTGSGIFIPSGGVGGDAGNKVDFYCHLVATAQPGTNGSPTTIGLGGAPSASNAWGGNGGSLGQPGLPGLGTLNPGIGGLPGYAVNTGGSGIVVNNLGNGQVFGVVY